MPKSVIENYIAVEDYADLPVRLANTFDPALPEPERLATSDDLARFLSEVSLPVRPLTPDDVLAVRRVRDRVRGIFEVRSPDQACDDLNRLLTGVGAERRAVVIEGSLRFTLQIGVTPNVAETIRSVAALVLASTVERVGWGRLRVCEADPCRDAFVDTSKRGSQRFCGPRCASRTHVSAFRHRKATKVNGALPGSQDPIPS